MDLFHNPFLKKFSSKFVTDKVANLWHNRRVCVSFLDKIFSFLFIVLTRGVCKIFARDGVEIFFWGGPE